MIDKYKPTRMMTCSTFRAHTEPLIVANKLHDVYYISLHFTYVRIFVCLCPRLLLGFVQKLPKPAMFILMPLVTHSYSCFHVSFQFHALGCHCYIISDKMENIRLFLWHFIDSMPQYVKWHIEIKQKHNISLKVFNRSIFLHTTTPRQ